MENISLDDLTARIVRRIVDSVHPQKIILFGSAARGNITSSSDLDFLIVIPSGGHRRKTAQAIYRNLIGIGFAADIVVVTQDDVEQYKDHPGMVIGPALKEGKVLYAS
jgi:predicted nucleotidyltransferase